MPSLGLRFPTNYSHKLKARVTYAFQTFCAIYGYKYRAEETHADVVLCYGLTKNAPNEVSLSSSYKLSEDQAEIRPSYFAIESANSVKIQYPCFHSFDVSNGGPDWLAEIFEWISGSHETRITERDTIGRIPFNQTVHAKLGLAPEVPYANIAMNELNKIVSTVLGSDAIQKPQKPVGLGEITIVSTHDLDHIPVTLLNSMARIAKNFIISILVYKDISLAIEILLNFIKGSLRCTSPLDNIDEMLKLQRQKSIKSSYYPICQNNHPKDADYSMSSKKVLRTLRKITESGFEIGVHGSFESLVNQGQLQKEYQLMRELGFPVVGGTTTLASLRWTGAF